MTHLFKKIFKYKKTKDCIFLGTGSTINDISINEWEKIKNMILGV